MMDDRHIKIKSECEHITWDVGGSYPIGRAYCYDCKEYIGLAEAFNGTAQRLQKLEKRLTERLEKRNSVIDAWFFESADQGGDVTYDDVKKLMEIL